ncbi:MAG: VOC family protein [Rhodospirillaceae bacterium]
MFARINHMAIISNQYPFLQKYYQSVFGLKTSGRNDFESASVVSDGNLGLNIIPCRDGYIGGLDHFGMVVDSIELVQERMKGAYDGAGCVKRPAIRPFAAYSGHDPDGNVFDLAENNSKNLRDVYSEETESTSNCSFSRFAIRTPNAERCAEFYSEVFELTLTNRKEGDKNFHLTDGKMTLSIMPWSVEIFAGMSVKRPGPDHIGFKVKDMEAFKAEEKRVGEKNTFLASRKLGGSEESEVRKQLFASNALGTYQTADPDGTWIDIMEE